jgi:hypothetical protein
MAAAKSSSNVADKIQQGPVCRVVVSSGIDQVERSHRPGAFHLIVSHQEAQLTLGLGYLVGRTSQVRAQIRQLHLQTENVIASRQPGPVHRFGLPQRLLDPADAVLGDPPGLVGQKHVVVGQPQSRGDLLGAPSHHLGLQHLELAGRAYTDEHPSVEQRLVDADPGRPLVVGPEAHGNQLIRWGVRVKDERGQERFRDHDVPLVGQRTINFREQPAVRLLDLLLRTLQLQLLHAQVTVAAETRSDGLFQSELGLRTGERRHAAGLLTVCLAGSQCQQRGGCQHAHREASRSCGWPVDSGINHLGGSRS